MLHVELYLPVMKVMEGKKAEHSLSIYTLNNFTGNVEGDDMRTHKSASNAFDYFYHEILTC